VVASVVAARRHGAAAVLVIGALAGLLVVLPLTGLVRVAVGGGLAGVTRALAAPESVRATVHTIAVALAVTAVAVPAGAALALGVERQAPVRRRVLRPVVASGLIVPEFVLGFGWTEAYGPAGLSDRLLGLRIPGLYGPAGIVLVLATHAVPLAYLIVTAGLAVRADADLHRAARASGAGGWAALRTITLPLLRVPLLAAAALVFASVVNSFAVPQLLGTPAGFATMSTLVYQDLNLSADPAAFTDLTVVALAMVVLVLLAVAPAEAWLGAVRTPPATVDTPVPAAGRLVTTVACTFATLTVGLPVLAVVLAALTRAPGLAPVPANWTLANFVDAFAGETGAALGRSLRLAAAAALLVPALGGLLAGLRGRWAGRPLAVAATLSYAVPGSALAVGVAIGYGRWLAGTALIILVAYLAKFWILGYLPVRAALDRLSPQPVRAARVSGAGPATTLATVVLPPLRTALVSAAALAFLFAFHELTMSSILYGPGSQTLAVVVLNQRELGNVGTTSALAVVLTVPVCLAAALLLRLRGRA
jgi:iron(III) transport system permease protein